MKPTLPRGLTLLLLALLSVNASHAEGTLESNFTNPPALAHPKTWWHWVSGNASKEGITADLEAMKKIGLSGAQIFTVDQSSVKGHVVFMSQEWRDLVKHSLSEAARLHLDISMEGCDGWSESGGHWVEPSQSMQKVVWSETQVQGGKNVPLTLPQPEANKGYYEDISLMALKSGADDLAPDPVKITTSPQLEKPVTGMPSTAAPVKFLATKGAAPFWIQYEFQQPITCASITCNLASNGKLPGFNGKLEVSDDGVTFRSVCELSKWQLANDGNYGNFPLVTGKFFRLTFNQGAPKDGWTPESLSKDILTVSKLKFAGFRLNNVLARTGMQVKTHLGFDTNSLPAIDAKDVIDLTGKTNWDAPEGTWTLLRIGHTSTGATTHPSTTPGLECDKLSAAAVNSHIDHLFKPVWEDSPDKAGSTFKYILLDSWECGCENWTPLMTEEFQKRRGYDLKPWLPALTGCVIGSVEETERFLWDYRRTLADLVAENHYGVFQKRAHEKGMGLMAEAAGIGLRTVADQLLCKKYCDVPMGEFWVNKSREENIDDPREAASAAHVYGQNIASCEAFTSSPNTAAWKNDPYSLKALGDQEFCNGVNLFIFHRYAHQPWLDRKPGMCMGPWGINFERTNTWWNQGSAWIDYISRCESLLQQGRFCADLCYFYGEGAPVTVRHSELRPAVPKGYDYDVCNADAILNLMETKEGRVTTPSGMSYRVLVLPPEDRMTLPVLQKIAKLVHDGAVVYGPKPLRSPSLSGYPGVDQELSKLADEVWGNCDGKNVTEHAYGAGRIVWGAPLEKVLGVPPDFSASKGDFLFIHRKDADAEIYFVSNQEKEAIAADCSFRVTGKVPELWHPDTGKKETVALYTTKDGLTTLPIHFDPVGSVFVIFRKPQGPAPHPVSVSLAEIAKKKEPVPGGLEILKATYGAEGKTADVTARIATLIQNGKLNIHADTATMNIPDPALDVVNQLSVEYKLNGVTVTQAFPENEKVEIGIAQPFTPESSLRTDVQNQTVMSAPQNGDYTITWSDGATKSIAVSGLPAPMTLEGPWNLVFPPFTEGRGEPVKATFDKLVSWSDSTDDAIKYFSGTATYTKTFTLPKGYLAKKRHLTLDLGTVKNLAEVTLNGKSLGTLWKEPFQIDVTGAVKDGENNLTIKVTNLWPNRLIGDQKLPEKERSTWASVSLYKATDQLLPSGLLGPVTIHSTAEVNLPQSK